MADDKLPNLMDVLGGGRMSVGREDSADVDVVVLAAPGLSL